MPVKLVVQLHMVYDNLNEIKATADLIDKPEQILLIFQGLITHTINAIQLYTFKQCLSLSASTLVLITRKQKYGRQKLMPQKKEMFVRMKISFVQLGKNECHRPNGLGSWTIIVVRQADKIVVVQEFKKLTTSNSEAHLSHLNRFILLITLYQKDLQLIFGAKVTLYGCLL